MRNFSMKKFGTPIGAGPGVASEKLGFDGVGTPFGLEGRGGGVAAERTVGCVGVRRPRDRDTVSSRG